MDDASGSSAQNYITSTRLLVTSHALLAVTSVVFLARVGLRLWRPKAIHSEDYILLVSFLMYVSLVTLYIVVTPAMYRVGDAITTGILYPQMLEDSLFLTKIFFATTMLLWFVLWGVKLAFLMLYRRLFSGIKFYVRLWWAVLIFCALTLIGCVISNFTSCHSMHAWFSPGECVTPRDVRAQIISLYFSFAVDVVTDLMIMFLPLGLIWKLQRPKTQKIGIGALFCIGWICIGAAVIRVVQVGVKSGSSSTPSSSWLAFWAVIESSIAIIIGCCPGLYATAKEVHKTRQGTSNYSYAGQYHGGSRGDEKRQTTSETEGTIRMKYIPITVDSTIDSQWKGHSFKSQRSSFSFFPEADRDSEEQLKPGQIRVSHSVDVIEAVSDPERDPRNEFHAV